MTYFPLLPIAKGEPRTRRCVVCRKVKPLIEYPSPPKRKCSTCFFGGHSATYRVSACVICGEAFTSKSSRGILCEKAECQRERATTMDRERRAAIRAGKRPPPNGARKDGAGLGRPRKRPRAIDKCLSS